MSFEIEETEFALVEEAEFFPPTSSDLLDELTESGAGQPVPHGHPVRVPHKAQEKGQGIRDDGPAAAVRRGDSGGGAQ